jgi:hypothetical protein
VADHRVPRLRRKCQQESRQATRHDARHCV